MLAAKPTSASRGFSQLTLTRSACFEVARFLASLQLRPTPRQAVGVSRIAEGIATEHTVDTERNPLTSLSL